MTKQELIRSIFSAGLLTVALMSGIFYLIPAMENSASKPQGSLKPAAVSVENFENKLEGMRVKEPSIYPAGVTPTPRK